MHPLSASELLNVWEYGLGKPSVQRGLALLAVAFPDITPDALAQLSIGQRDALLLSLREKTYGPQMTCLAACPSCGEHLEMKFPISELRSPQPSASQPPAFLPENQPLAVEIDDYQVTFRLVNSQDLEAVAASASSGSFDVTLARQQLLQRCLLEVIHRGEKLASASADCLPEPVVTAIQKRLNEVDPQANVTISLTCPACQHTWQTPFDILEFFWIEINSWAYRILEEVHMLASTYGWSEADILSMHPWRRQVYLDMINA